MYHVYRRRSTGCRATLVRDQTMEVVAVEEMRAACLHASQGFKVAWVRLLKTCKTIWSDLMAPFLSETQSWSRLVHMITAISSRRTISRLWRRLVSKSGRKLSNWTAFSSKKEMQSARPNLHANKRTITMSIWRDYKTHNLRTNQPVYLECSAQAAPHHTTIMLWARYQT